MAFNPALPIEDSEIESAELRAQFNGLKDIIDTTLPGPPGPEGPQGPPGEVTNAQLNDAVNSAITTAMASSSANSNGISTLDLSVSDPPTQSDVQQILGKLNDLIIALRR